MSGTAEMRAKLKRTMLRHGHDPQEITLHLHLAYTGRRRGLLIAWASRENEDIRTTEDLSAILSEYGFTRAITTGITHVRESRDCHGSYIELS